MAYFRDLRDLIRELEANQKLHRIKQRTATDRELMPLSGGSSDYDIDSLAHKT